MRQLLIAVKSTFEQQEDGTHDMVRSTWGQKFRGLAYVRFFLGRPTQNLGGMVKSLPAGRSIDGAVATLPGDKEMVMAVRNSYVPQSDEIVLDVPDYSLVKKSRAICGYAMGKNITHAVLVNVHTNVGVKEVMQEPFEIADYAGDFGETFGTVEPRVFWNGEENESINECYGWARGDGGIFLSRKAMAEIADTPPRPSLYINDQNDDVWIGQVLGAEVQRGNLLAMPIKAVAA